MIKLRKKDNHLSNLINIRSKNKFKSYQERLIEKTALIRKITHIREKRPIIIGRSLPNVGCDIREREIK